MVMSFSSCKKDDAGSNNDSNLLVGKWEASGDYIQENGNWVLENSYNPGACIWTFNDTYLVVADPTDAMNGQKVNYSYDSSKKILTLSGWARTVYKLTSTDFEIDCSVAGDILKTTFKKVQ